MPIISPKCPQNYKLLKSQCKCKKKVAKTTKKKKKVVKKTKLQTKKIDKHLETKKKLAQEIIDLHVSLGIKTGKLTTLTQLVKLNVGDLRKDIKKYKKMVRTKVRNVKKAVKQQEKRETKKKKAVKKKERDKKTKKVKKKEVKKTKKVKKTIKQIREECKEKGLVFDTHTRKCRERKQTKKLQKLKRQTKKIEKPKRQTQKIKTPKPDIHVKKTPKQQKHVAMTRLRSYSPSVNKLISRKNVDQLKLTGFGCRENEIKIGGGECLGWKNKKTEEILLNNLKSKKPINAKDVLGPNQNRSNCWFNSFFVMFFISDKGRKFMKNFRRAMITGNITPNGKKKIPQKLRYPFWLLNKMVEASLIGRKDPYTYASLMDTNDVIKKIYKNLKSPNEKKGFYRKPGQAGNPVEMIEKIMKIGRAHV